MVSYRLIGSAVTDGQGIAHLDYTGSGAGEVDVIASTSHPISETSLVSNAKEFYDCMFYDSGTTGTVNPKWKTVQGTGNVVSNANGTKFENVDSDTRFDNFLKNENNEIYYWNAPFCIEFETTQITGTPRLQIFSSTTNQALNTGGSVGKYKVIYDGSIVTVLLQGSSSSTYERVMPNARIGFYAVKGHSITFKDLKIYPLSNDEVATLFYDKAIASNYNPNWKLGSSPTINRDENGTTLSSSDTTWRNMTVSINGIDNLYFSNPVCIEFDVVSLTNTCRMEIYYSTDYRFLSTFANYGVGHYRVEYTATQQKLYVNDVLKQTENIDFTGKDPRFTLVVWNEGALKFKNFKIYEI